MKNKKGKTILVFGDMHMPYLHKDAIDFLREVKRVHKPNEVYSTGDLIDHHALSFHESDADLYSAGQELKLAIKSMKQLYKLFPKCTVCESNHGSMAARKFKVNGIPMKFLKSLEEVYEAPKSWKWVENILLKLDANRSLFITHGMRADSLKLAQELGLCVVQGHHHSKMGVQYGSSPLQLYFGAMAGCLIDDKSLAFAYNKLQSKRPLMGCLIIKNGVPVSIPMTLNKNGRWIKEL